MRYKGLEFIYNGVLSSTKKIVLAEMDGDYKETVNPYGTYEVATDKPLRSKTSYLYGGYYSEQPRFSFKFATLEYLSTEEIADIHNWLFNNDDGTYKKLEIVQDDLTGYHYNCILVNPQPTLVNGYMMAWECEIVCDSPFMWKDDVMYIPSNGSVQINNQSQYDKFIYVPFEFKATGSTVTITNTSDNNRATTFNNLTSGEVIKVDELHQIKSSKNIKRLKDSNGVFLRLVKGVNNITITGNYEYFSVTYREAKMIGR